MSSQLKESRTFFRSGLPNSGLLLSLDRVAGGMAVYGRQSTLVLNLLGKLAKKKIIFSFQILPNYKCAHILCAKQSFVLCTLFLYKTVQFTTRKLKLKKIK